MTRTTEPRMSRAHTGRARNEQARRDILEAALELAQQGLGQTSMDAIAFRAGVGKKTIYRWWPSKAAVVLDALLDRAAHAVPAVPNGPLETDLAQFLRTAFHAITRPGGAGPLLRALMAEAQDDPQFAEQWREQFIKPRRRVLTALIDAAVDRDEVDPHLDREFLADLLFGAMWYRLLVDHAPLDERFAHQLARSAHLLAATAAESALDLSSVER